MKLLVIFSLALPPALARTTFATVEPDTVARELHEVLGRTFEKRIHEDFTPTFMAALLKTAFPNDAAEIDREFAGQEGPARLRGVERDDDGGYRLTAPDGREFTIAPTDSPGAMVVNGQRVDFSGGRLRPVLIDFARALNRSLVARHFPAALFSPRRAEAFIALAPGLFTALAIALVVVYQNWASGSSVERVETHFLHLATVCEADRVSGQAFEKSATGRAYVELLRKEITLGAADEGCRASGEDDAASPPGLKKSRFSAEERRRACRAREGFETCATSYRGARGTPVAIRSIPNLPTSSN